MSTRVNPKIRKNNPTKVITSETCLSYVNAWETKSINGDKPRYSVSLLVPKDDAVTIDVINAAIEAATTEGIGKFDGKIPSRASLKLPLRDGDTEHDDDAYVGYYFVNTNSISAPQIVDQDVNPILNRSKVYSGRCGRASINFYVFNTSGNRGAARGLGNTQKTRDGEPLGGHVNAESELDTWGADEDFLA